MNTKSMIIVCAISVPATVGIVCEPAAAQTILRVDGDNGTVQGDGTAWGEDAYKYLQDAIEDAAASASEQNPYELWVAATDPENPYLPDRDAANPNGTCGSPCEPYCYCTDYERSFELINHVQILGGFAGDETDASDRLPAINVTVLSGDLAQDDDGTAGSRESNSSHVVYAGSSVDDTAVIDGFIITAGNAYGERRVGGGILIDMGSPRIYRCIFEGNYAESGGGGAHVEKSSAAPAFVNCVFASNDGGPLAGALCVNRGAVTVVNSLFYENQSTDAGGAIYLEGDHNFTFAVNLINCTITDNEATSNGPLHFGNGGGIRAVWVGTPGSSDLTIINCILWGNVDHDSQTSLERAQINADEQIDLSVSYTTIEGLDEYEGNNNLGDDPLFANASGANYRLTSDSPCKDTGLDSAIEDYPDGFDLDADSDTNEATPDLDLANRILDGGSSETVDMGAYEYIANCSGDTNDDQIVDILDLLKVLAEWGTSDPDADVNDDDTVDILDLLLVLASWGPCGNSGSFSPPQSVYDCLQQYSGYPAKQAGCIQAILLTQ